MTWAGARDFTSGFYFREVKTPKVDLEFSIDGPEPLWISDITVHAHPDAIYREFEHGLVLANPAPRPYVFDLGRFFPKTTFRRIKGSPRQDPATNDGSIAPARLTLAPKDALFLVKDN